MAYPVYQEGGPSVQKLIDGVNHFQSRVVPLSRDFFAQQAKGQWPDALFITCSDSRIDPNLITQTHPGELFVVRNAGNIVPAYDPNNLGAGGEGPTVEYAIQALNVKHIIVCGHSHCGAMKGVLAPESVTSLPLVAAWLKQADETYRRVQEQVPANDPDILNRTVEINVLVQLENLRSYPVVAEAIAAGKVQLHGWVYHVETGETLTYDTTISRFVPLSNAYSLDYTIPSATTSTP
jgi:carbonic anhydrase